MSSGFEGAGWLWRFIGGDEAPGMWHHTDNAEHVELVRRRTICEVRDLAFADDVRQLAESRAELLEAAQRVIAHRIGDLPNRGDLRDNDASRRDIAALAQAIANATQQRNATGGEG